MANSRFQYVRSFEQDDRLLPQTFMVVRIDGKGFHKFSEKHKFEKPNDRRGLAVMNAAALAVIKQTQDIFMAFGESDEYSFAFGKDCELYNRRQSKILTYVVSLFTSAYCRQWKTYFGYELDAAEASPTFDGRLVQYPAFQHIKDYFKWRQADTHINNLYNTCFWKLIDSGSTTAEAHKALKGTVSSQKNELLFSKFDLNYNTLPEIFRRGSIILRKSAKSSEIATIHEDLLKDAWWDRSELSAFQ